MFDLSNTLVEFDLSKVEQEFNIPYMKRAGYDISVERWVEAKKTVDGEIERNSPEIADKFGGWMYLMSLALGINMTMEKCIEEEKAFNDYAVKKSRLMSNALKILNFLKDQGIKLIVMSNMKKEVAEKVLEKHNIKRFFDFIVNIEELGYKKSSLTPFKVVLNELRYPPNECIMVGDRLDEDAYCKRVGINFVWISKFKREFYRTIEGYDFEIKDLMELKPIVFDLMKR